MGGSGKWIVGVVLACLAIAGCGGGAISTDKLEQEITDRLTQQVGQRPDKVECPDALDGAVGAQARCVLTAGQTQIGVTATVTGVEGSQINFDIKVDDKPIS